MFLFLDISLFAIVFKALQKYHFFSFTGTVFEHCLMRKEVKFPECIAHITKRFSESFPPVFIRRYCLLTHRPEYVPECSFANTFGTSMNPSMKQCQHYDE